MLRFISYFDGEKDPRNLMVIFSILQVPATEWDVSANAQDLFNAAFNYFPITFRPPPDDPYGITAQNLKDRLRGCISASAYFAPYAFPALLDKLDSTSTNTKVRLGLSVLAPSPANTVQRDVLQALFDCVSKFGSRTVSLYAVTLWDALKFEVLHVQEEDLAEEALKTLSQIAIELSREAAESLPAYLRPIGKECNEHLEDAPTKQSQAAARILRSIASASSLACNVLTFGLLPRLFMLYQSTDVIAKRRALVETLGQLLHANIVVFGDWRAASTPNINGVGSKAYVNFNSGGNALRKLSQQTLDILRTAIVAAPIKEVSFRLALLDTLTQLAKVRGVLSDEEIAGNIRIFSDIVVSEESYGKDELKEVAINSLVEVAHQKPQVVIDHAFPAFLATLPDKDSNGPETYVPTLEAFAKLGSEALVFDTVVLRLKNKFNAAVHNGASSTYLEAILSALLYAFSQSIAGASSISGPENPTDFEGYFHNLVIPLIKQVVVELDADRQNDAIFYLTARLTNVILRILPSDTQKTLSGEAYPYLGYSDSPACLSPLQNGSDNPRRIILSTYIVAALRRDVPLPSKASAAALAKCALSNDLSLGTKVATLQQLSLVINKFIPLSNIKSVLEPILHSSLSLLSPQNLNPDSIRVIFAVFKGLVLRNAPALDAIISSLLSALSDPHNGRIVAHGFSTVLQADEILTKEDYCIISALHKQKIFMLLVPELAAGFRQADTSVKPNYLIALAGILRWLPYTILSPQLESLIPLLLQTLDIDGEDDVKAGTIDTLISILNANPKALEEHASSLITRLLKISAGDKNAPARVRAEALKCLNLVSVRMRTEIIVPFMKQVVKRLVTALDDRKRNVRAEAVRCRAKWIDLDEAGDEDV
jgi:DNA repair/transcription protein MET18/MMS19